MDLARYLVDAVVLEKRSCREVARAHGVSKSWVAQLVARFNTGGYEAIAPGSRAAKKVANRSSAELEDRVVRIHKELSDQGFDAGAQTIHYHLARSDPSPPSVSTIWRILKRRGFVTPQPHKRPQSSYVRFEASLPNEMWQSDATFFELKDGTKVEILNFLDDFSRVCVASRVRAVTSAPDVVATLYEAGGAWSLPASVLTDIQTRSRSFESLDQAADETRIRGTGAHLPPLLDRTERSATPCLLITGRVGPPPGRRCVLLGTR